MDNMRKRCDAALRAKVTLEAVKEKRHLLSCPFPLEYIPIRFADGESSFLNFFRSFSWIGEKKRTKNRRNLLRSFIVRLII